MSEERSIEEWFAELFDETYVELFKDIEVPVFMWLACAAFASAIANAKGRGWVRWLIAGLFFGPVAMLAAGLMPRMSEERAETRLKDQNERDK